MSLQSSLFSGYSPIQDRPGRDFTVGKKKSKGEGLGKRVVSGQESLSTDLIVLLEFIKSDEGRKGGMKTASI